VAAILRCMSATTFRVLVETTPKKVFVSALDWPGLSRGGKTEEAAVDAFLAAVPRYAPVAAAAGFPFDTDELVIDVAERVEGDASTAFGVPAIAAALDREPVDADDAARLVSLVEAAWAELDRIAAASPEELRKGPRGGGRDRSKMVGHVIDAEAAYAAVMGRKHRPVDAAAVVVMRADILEVLRQSSDGSPIAGRRWPPRYAARRVAWHVLDHAWEIEDRSDPG
jgi:hypothetical protein